MILTATTFTPIFANEAIPVSNISTISPCKEEFVWRYKTMNGKLYKRLWNNTLKKWASDHWIQC